MPLSISVTALLALAVLSLRRRPVHGRLLPTIALMLIIVWIPAMTFEAWRMFPQTNPDPITGSAKKKQIGESRDAPEYRPRWNQSIGELNWEASVDIDDWDQRLEDEFDSLIERVTPAGGSAPEIKIIQGNGRATVTLRKPGEIDLHVETPTGVSFEAPQFFYPYWNARMLDDTTRLILSPSTPDGLVTLSVPPGNHDVQLRLERSGAELAGEIISLASAAIALTLGLYFGYFKPTGRG
jgi:hypothetical protein